MTLIAAVVHDGSVHMIGDSYSGFAGTVGRDTRKKVWLAGDKIIGAAGNVRPITVFRYGFEFPEQPAGQDDDTYMRFTVPSALRAHLQEHVHIHSSEDGEDSNLGLLIGWRGRLWRVTWDFAVTESADGYDVIGSGTEAALGSLATTATLGAYGPCARLQAAAETAARLIETVRAPFTFLRLAAQTPPEDQSTCLSDRQAFSGDQIALHVDASGAARGQSACGTCQHWSARYPVAGQAAEIGTCAVLHAGARLLRPGILRPDKERLITPVNFGCIHHEARE